MYTYRKSTNERTVRTNITPLIYSRCYEPTLFIKVCNNVPLIHFLVVPRHRPRLHPNPSQFSFSILQQNSKVFDRLERVGVIASQTTGGDHTNNLTSL